MMAIPTLAANMRRWQPVHGVAFGRLMAALHGLTALGFATVMCDRASTNQIVAARITKRRYASPR